MRALTVMEDELNGLFSDYSRVDIRQQEAGDNIMNSCEGAFPESRKPLFATVWFSTDEPNDSLSVLLQEGDDVERWLW